MSQLHGVLSAWMILPSVTKSWEEAVAAISSGDPYPMSPFAYLVQSLRSLLGEGPLQRPGARLCLPDGPLRTAAVCRYGKRPGLEDMAHLLLAALLWKSCDPDGSGTFQNCPPEALEDLPYHLVSAEHPEGPSATALAALKALSCGASSPHRPSLSSLLSVCPSSAPLAPFPDGILVTLAGETDAAPAASHCP